jgi:hypothetical protein
MILTPRNEPYQTPLDRFGDSATAATLSSPISLGSGSFHEGKQYYFKFIHEKNQKYFQKASLDIKSSTFVPYEAGRKIPINERV